MDDYSVLGTLFGTGVAAVDLEGLKQDQLIWTHGPNSTPAMDSGRLVKNANTVALVEVRLRAPARIDADHQFPEPRYIDYRAFDLQSYDPGPAFAPQTAKSLFFRLRTS